MHCNCESAYEEHDLVECITSALDARDPYTGNHSRRVSDMACDLCHVLGMPEDHDIGKIGIPDKVLLKPGRLNDEEWELMKQHSKIGADILAGAPKFARIAAIILHHHERFDGKGYPFGEKGEKIPLGSRIIAVCDSIDAMASIRAYRGALPLETVRSEIEKNSGLMYDHDVAKAMLDNWQIVENTYR
jgi:HD-GYP domain-containing protein (c-di-GMP phosphodiesterase class II)